MFDLTAEVLVSRPYVIEQNRTAVCAHETVAGRALTGTWVLDEIRLYLQKVYELLKVYKFLEYEVTQ
jgi:hypothetical protein